MAPLKNFSPESIRTIARNPNIDFQSERIYSKSEIQHHRTQQFQELPTKYKNNQAIKTYGNSLKQQVSLTSTDKTIVDTLKILKTIYILSVKITVHS